ncbi:uncharacterized protein LOC126613626 isoform X2 [Malus sylvestris]|uniref:uncharacterized protein LOC126613626 isoform X2 n=1 Tax=Malus sylvestris TaxID=3752 RepID=UPI0021ABBE18|nr:uncharacterized protein LOC126613626 isoform X2 [Malus sylvestris]
MDAGKLARESTQIVSRILVKALKAMLSPDFSLCLCLIPERVGFGKLSLVAALAAQLAASIVQAGTKEITTKRNHCHQQLWLHSSSLSSIPPKFHYLSLLSLRLSASLFFQQWSLHYRLRNWQMKAASLAQSVKEEWEETLEKIKEGELIMVLMNSHLELVTTNQLTINFRSRLNYALNVKLALRFNSLIQRTLGLKAELLNQL